ncbi:amino acid transporter [Piedraia hortae CBS 480.64]|uniref:Amino acid transporter n=1 Tax=Piedraia hortae CBS 480.64 TaxID=1314780 RepID=A0A6A7BWQ8_9PEZI|nr:amino acid transporter [Piedraia hortae CBS 480.64]
MKGPSPTTEDVEYGGIVVATGHIQELNRNFSLLSLAGVGLSVGNVWPAIGGSIVVAIFNGGPPGVLYEFLTVSVFYWFVAASLAELASAIPSSASVYQWATITPGRKWGRPIGFFAGYWNWLGWTIGDAAMTAIVSQSIVQMWAANHADFKPKAWHVFVIYTIITWIACLTVCFFNVAVPYFNKAGIFFVLAGYTVILITVTVMPSRSLGGKGHASSSVVWKEWKADLGYPDGFVFISGMLNGAYSVGTPDCTTHLAEEIPHPERNVPIAILCQMAIGFVTGFSYLIAILYAINDYDALLNSTYPIAEIYHQATGSAAGTTGLLFPIMLCIFMCVLGSYVTCGRALWTLARDGATPFPSFVGKVHPNLAVPFNATLLCAVLITVLGAIYMGSTTAFNAFAGSYILFSSSSYIAAILPNLLCGRRHVPACGAFKLKGWSGHFVNAVACGYLVMWFVVYCFPFSLPTDRKKMNYGVVLWGGFTLIVAAWWVVTARKGYEGPPLVVPEEAQHEGGGGGSMSI